MQPTVPSVLSAEIPEIAIVVEPNPDINQNLVFSLVPDTVAYIKNNRYLIGITCILILIFASRVVRINTLEMDRDEIWSVWQTFGTPAQIIRWTPSDWSPLYYLIVGTWKGFVGIHPFVLRLLPLFGFMLGIAILYRVTAKLFDRTTALLACAACAAIGYSVNISLLVRGYNLVFALTVLAWLYVIRYFHRPTLRRGILLGVCLAALFYMHVTTIFAIAMLGLYTLITVSWRKLWRWVLPGFLAAVIITPEILSKFWIASSKASTGMPVLRDWLASNAQVFFQILGDLMRDFAGYSLDVWIALLIIASALVLDRYRMQRRSIILLVWMLAPVYLFFVGLFDAFTNRHLFWVMIGYTIWIGWGLSRLPRAGRVGVLGVFAILMFAPVPMTERYKIIDAPLLATYTFIAEHFQSADVVVIDPKNKAAAPEEWDYYTRAFFPSGLTFATDPGNSRRVWYISVQGMQDPSVYAAVQQKRAQELSLVQDKFIVQLYEAPPNTDGILFENGMRFHGVENLDQTGPYLVRREGETIHLRLWWSVDKPVSLDYSVGTYVQGHDAAGQPNLVGQFDGPPQVTNGGPQATSQWVPGRYYIEDRDITLAYPLTTGTYPLSLAVYFWQDGKRINAPGVDANTSLPLLTVNVKAW